MTMRIGVVGAGTMGRGIAALCAQSGFEVFLHDAVPDALSSARARIADALSVPVKRGKLTQAQAQETLARVREAWDLQGLERAEAVIEATSEDLAVKRRVFERLGRILPASSVLATNTSSLSVALVAEPVRHPERVLGLHFFNPPAAMRLVEVVRAPATSEAAFRSAWSLAESLGRVPVATKDTPGFIVNRVVRPFYIEGQRAAEEGWGGFSAVDSALREAEGLPMGPFELMDLIGLDVNLAITKVLYEALGRPERIAPRPIQEALVRRGDLGRKAGKGFYLYKDGKPAGENPEAAKLLPAPALKPAADIARRVLDAVGREARLAFEQGVASREDIDTAVRLAMNFPKGPFEREVLG